MGGSWVLPLRAALRRRSRNHQLRPGRGRPVSLEETHSVWHCLPAPVGEFPSLLFLEKSDRFKSMSWLPWVFFKSSHLLPSIFEQLLALVSCILRCYFRSSSRFTAELRRGYKHFLCAPFPDTRTASLIINIPTRIVYLLQSVNLYWHTIIYPKSVVYIRVHSWWCVFTGFGQMCNDMCLSLYIQSVRSLCPKIPCVLPVHPLFLPNPWRPLICLLILVLSFPECHLIGIIVCCIFRLAFFTW